MAVIPERVREYFAPLRRPGGWLPFLRTLRGYSRGELVGDVGAGATVALVAVPQAMAYAMVAGLDPSFGLYAAVVAGFLGALFGSSSHLVTGPSVLSIVVGSVLAALPSDVPVEVRVASIGLAMGLWQFLFGVLKLGNIGQFISQSVLLGLVSGAAIVIAGTQIAPLLGLQIESSSRLLPTLVETARRVTETDPRSLMLGGMVIVILVVGGRIRASLPWPILALAAAASATVALGWAGDVATIGAIPRSLPQFTVDGRVLRLLPEAASPALALALLGVVSSLSIAKSIGSLTGETIAPNRELVGQGIANLGAGAFGGMPSSGSFVRSFTEYAAGGRTRFAGVFAAAFALVAIVLLGDVGRWIPRAGLAGLVIVLALRMVRLDRVRIAFRSTKSDAAVWLLTFLGALVFRLDIAIYCGIGLSLASFLKKASAPYLAEYSIEEGGGFREIHDASERRLAQIAIIHVEGDLFFGAADLFETGVRHLAHEPDVHVIVLRMRGARYLDATALVALGNLQSYVESLGKHLLMCGIGDRVMSILERSGLAARLGPGHVFHARDGVLVSTRRALQVARDLVDAEKGVRPEVRLFYDRESRRKGRPH